MSIDDIGRVFFRSNVVEITPETVKKRYRNFALSMLWGTLERKPYRSARRRYQREKEIIPKLRQAGLNTPELICADDEHLVLTWRSLELTEARRNGHPYPNGKYLIPFQSPSSSLCGRCSSGCD